jgi:hypothetical protein
MIFQTSARTTFTSCGCDRITAAKPARGASKQQTRLEFRTRFAQIAKTRSGLHEPRSPPSTLNGAYSRVIEYTDATKSSHSMLSWHSFHITFLFWHKSEA